MNLIQMGATRDAYRAWEAGDARSTKVGFGNHWLHRAVGAFRAGTLLTVGGRTNAGKTYFLLELARACAVPSVVVSCEDDVVEIGRRTGHWSPAELAKVHVAFPTYPTLETVVECVRAGHEGGAKAAFVDYAQAIAVPGMGGQIAEATGHLCKTYKGLLRELDMFGALGSQIRRPAPGTSQDSEPSIYDLRDGSALENTSDVVVLLHKVDDVTLQAKIGKSKWTATGATQLYTRGVGGRLDEVSQPVESEEW